MISRPQTIWKILHKRVRYEERGPAVSVEAKKVRARKVIRELRSGAIQLAVTIAARAAGVGSSK